MSSAITVRNALSGDADFIKKCLRSLINVSFNTKNDYKYSKFDPIYKHILKNPEETPIFIA